MIKLPLNDARVSRAFETLKEKHNEYNSLKFAKLFEEVYHCKVVADPTDAFCLNGWLEIPEGKYYTWFAIQFGGNFE